ncbi:LysR family transcriptional regulator [Ramlibacter henchirensis]|uniref:LysR family transcriptional regulator n=1 Tax=Ramlibacter henchirensis TaxID=204072 RepID=A0A4Z0C953_9BURK|nr:LysR family transcriptional regulator [Ramlibacter henchirensis]TFZ06938.1 LysR family transcriptional regulator [Ramlibacter henchirensis]
MPQRDIRSLDVAMLRTFDALMRERSVSRAAGRLFLSQPAVSASLNRLREVFGDPLFTRTSHGIVPTARAHALGPQVAKVLADIAGLLEGDRFDPARSQRVFRVAGSDHASRLVLPELSRRLVDAGSQARIHWVPPGLWSLAEHLHRRELDLAVVARIHRPRDIETQVLYEDHYVHVVRRAHPQASEPLTLDTFCSTPQVFLGYGTSTLDDTIDETLRRSGHARLAQVAVSSFGQIVHQLLHSDHAAVLGRRVALHYAEQLCIREVPFELPRYQSLLCWSPGAASDTGVTWLREQVADIVGIEPESGAAVAQ